MCLDFRGKMRDASITYIFSVFQFIKWELFSFNETLFYPSVCLGCQKMGSSTLALIRRG